MDEPCFCEAPRCPSRRASSLSPLRDPNPILRTPSNVFRNPGANLPTTSSQDLQDSTNREELHTSNPGGRKLKKFRLQGDGRCPAQLMEEEIGGGEVPRQKSTHFIPGDKSEEDDLQAIEAALNSLADTATVLDLVMAVSKHTGDNGSILRKVLGDELQAFRKFVNNVFDNHIQDVADLLAHEQTVLKDKYIEWTKNLNHRIRRTKRLINRIIPNLDLQQYEIGRIAYLKEVLAEESGEYTYKNEEEEQDEFDHWRQENFLKLLYQEDEVRKLQAENEELTALLGKIRRKKMETSKCHSNREQYIHQKNIMLKLQVQQLQHKKNRLFEVINQLFLRYEDMKANM